ncbi:hypothetical protein DICA3_C20538 [Diutina catenulata]
MPITVSDNLVVTKFSVSVEGAEPFDVEVGGPDLRVKIPESSKYVTTVHFKVTGASVKAFQYKQVAKKAGIPIKSRDILVGDYEPSDTEYSFPFPEDTTPGGFLMRGSYPITSTYIIDGEDKTVIEWTTEVVAK